MNSLEQTTQLVIDLIKQNKASDFEFSIARSSGVSTAVRLSTVETLQYHLDTSFDVSVYFGKNKGQATSVDLSKESLKKAIDSACMIAKYTQEDPFNGLAPKDKMAWDAPDLDLYHPWKLEAKQSIEIATECEQIALEQKEIDNSDGAELSSYEGETYYANSNGLVTSIKNTRHSLHCSLIAKRNAEMQTAYEYSIALDSNDLISPSKIGQKAASLAQQKLGSRNLKSQKCPVIFVPRQSSGLFSQLLGALSGSRQFKKTSFLLDSLGKVVLNESICIFERLTDRTEVPGCSLCMGNQARVEEGASVVSTSTRNFPNRLGDNSNVFLASAEVAAISAKLGYIPTSEEYLSLMKDIEPLSGEIYQYLNFDQIADYQESSSNVPLEMILQS